MARVNVILPDDLLKELDRAATAEGLSRSGALQEASRMYLVRRREQHEAEERRSRMQKATVEMDRLADKFGTWDGVTIVRHFRESRSGGKA